MNRAFDLSDGPSDYAPPEDTLDDVLAIAGEILAEYGEDPAAKNARIYRLAWWMVANVGGEPHRTERNEFGTERYQVHAFARTLVRSGEHFATEHPSGENSLLITPFAVGRESALAFATAIIRATERTERSEAREP